MVTCTLTRGKVTSIFRASDISRGRGSAKFRYFREIPRNSPQNAKYREIRQKYFQLLKTESLDNAILAFLLA